MCRHAVFLAVALLSCTSPDPSTLGKEVVAQPRRHSNVTKPKSSPFIGVLVPRNAATLTAPMAGVVTQVYVRLGDAVGGGDSLIALDSTKLLNALSIAQSDLEKASAALVAARLDRASSESNLARERKARQGGASSDRTVEVASYDVKRAVAVVSQATANEEEQRARVDAAKRLLEDTTIRAPFAGRIAGTFTSAGTRVVEGEPLVRLVASDDLFVRFAIPAEEARSISSGDEVVVTCYESFVLAQVSSVSPELDPVSQMVLAEAELSKQGIACGPGAICHVFVDRTVH